MFEENSVRLKSRDYLSAIVENLRNVFSPHENEKSEVLNSSCFQTAPFPWRISVDDRPNRGNKAAFFNFSRVAKFMHFFSSDLLTVEEKNSLSVSQDIFEITS